MRSEKEFVKAMWQQIDIQEQYVLENEKARQIYRKLAIRNTILVIALVLVCSTIMFFLRQYISSYIYIIAFIVIVIAYLVETRENSAV
ncbi:MAG TPA: hypothetical protein VJZ06_00070 [Mobilitalea sp.]|nr:hypothetical protein [Mobilitalea sp.]